MHRLGGDYIKVTGLILGSDEEFAARSHRTREASAVSGTNYDVSIDVASDSNITAQAFNNVAATATSSRAYADAYTTPSQVSQPAWTPTLAVSAAWQPHRAPQSPMS